jgi:hypothetical protein
MMKSRIAIALSALTLGTALAVVPSFAQTNGQPGATAAQQSTGCVRFQQDCSNKPYPMANGQQSGTSQNSTTRSASSGQQPSSESRTAANRGAYRLGEPNSYYNSAPGAEVGPVASNDVQRCAMRFRSFDPATGTYMGFDGIRHACP